MSWLSKGIRSTKEKVGDIKSLLKYKDAAKQAVKSAKEIKAAGQKEGYKTTEFYLTILTNVVALVGALGDKINPEVSALIVGVSNTVYAYLRTKAKA